MTTVTADPIEEAMDQTAGYLVLKEATCRDVNGHSRVHLIGTVLSSWEVEPYVKRKIAEGSWRYRALFEPLTTREVQDHRVKATALEGDHLVDGQHVSPPWEDYVGLHVEEVIERMRKATDRGLLERVRIYERGGLNREPILSYTAPAERPPWLGYDDLNVREVQEKLALLAPEAVHEVLAYEAAHRRRPAILTYEPELTSSGDGDSTTESNGDS